MELELEQVLHGTWGYKKVEVDAANRPTRILEEVPPVNGFDVQLTIDLEVQQYAEQLLETTLIKRRTQLAPNPIVRKPDRRKSSGSGMPLHSGLAPCWFSRRNPQGVPPSPGEFTS